MKYKLLIFALASFGLYASEPSDSVATQGTDSIAVSHQLEEFVVVSDRAWIEGNKAIFLPTKQEKNLATDPATLIQRMKIPMLVVDNGTIKNTQGNTVPVYINGQPADAIDIATFWAKRTNRVEYIDHPDDPRYQGAQAVINIIMPEYEIGGITKLSANQTIPGGGKYSAASKLVYKKMTYGILLNYGYTRNHSKSQEGFERYNDIFYNGDFYDKIEHDYSGHSWSRNNNFNASFNVRYATERTHLTNTISFTHNSNPGSGSFDSDSWTPSLFSSNSSRTASSSHALSPSLTGQVSHIINQKVSTNTAWQYSYAHNDYTSLYQNGDMSPITNITCEDVHSASLSETVAYILKQNAMGLFFGAGTSMDWYSTKYSGSTDAHQRQWRGQTTFAVSYRFIVAQKFSFSIDPGVLFDYWHLYGMDTHNSVKPSARLNMQWGINNRSSLLAYVNHFSQQPTASESGDVIIRQDELNWIKADENLRNNNSWSAGIAYTWMPLRVFDILANVSYGRDENEIISIYEQAPANMGGVIRTYTNGAAVNTYSLNINAKLRLLKEKMYIFVQPVLDYQDVGGIYSRSLFHSRLRAGMSYDLSNFGFSLYYSSPQKAISNGGMTTDWFGQSLNFNASYGNGDWFVNLSFGNLLRQKEKQTRHIYGGIYEQQQTQYNIGRCIELRATYTFGYGKRVDRNISIDSAGEIKSGALTY